MENYSLWVEKISQMYALPYWLVQIAPIFLLILALLTIFLVYKMFEPRYKYYTQDEFFSVLWQWKYKKNKIIDLWCYCPTCKSMLVVDDENCRTTQMLGQKITFFICNECGESEKGRIKGGDRRFALANVRREIERKIREKSFDIHTLK